jgi:hypothetical protein
MMPLDEVMAMSRYGAINRSRFRLNRVEQTWRELLHAIRAEAERLDYCGPSISSLERTLDDILAHQQAITNWLCIVAGKPQRRKITRRKLREIQQATGETAKIDQAAVLKEAFAEFAARRSG